MRSLIIHKDRRFEYRDISEMPVYHVARYTAPIVRWDATFAPDIAMIETDDFYRRGRLENGTPVYCETGVELREYLRRDFVEERYVSVALPEMEASVLKEAYKLGDFYMILDVATKSALPWLPNELEAGMDRMGLSKCAAWVMVAYIPPKGNNVV